MQIGVSPKVALPAIALVALGGIPAALGVVLGDETVTRAGVVLLAAAGVQLPVGYVAQPGNVQRSLPPEPGNDQLHALAKSRAEAS